MLISSDIFESYIVCPTKCFLSANGHDQKESTYSLWLKKTSEKYKNIQISRLKETHANNTILASPDKKRLLKSDWDIALSLVISTPYLKANIQAVKRLTLYKKGLKPQITPFHFTFVNKITQREKLLSSFLALTLSEFMGIKIEYVKIIHGEGGKATKVKVQPLFRTVKKLINQIDSLIRSSEAPELVLNHHCDECVFYGYCRQKALEKNDLSLLPSISSKERKKYNNKGIFTVTQLSYTFRPRRRPKKLKDKREKYHHSLKALSIREKKVHIIGDFLRSGEKSIEVFASLKHRKYK